MAKRLNRFELRFTPLDSDHPDPLERACAIALSVHAGGRCLTQVQDRFARTVRSEVRVSGYRLALWFAGNWWRLRWEPEQDQDDDWHLSHVMAGAGGGFIWPALSFIGDGECMVLRMRPSRAKPAECVRYLEYADIPLPMDEVVTELNAFVEAIIARLRENGLPNTALEHLWQEINQERQSAEAREWRKLEALAGFDPGAEEAEFLEPLLARREELGWGVIEEIVAGAKSQALVTIGHLLDGARQAALPLHFADVEGLRCATLGFEGKRHPSGTANVPPLLPWEKGYAIAAKARAYWGLPPGKVSNGTLMELFGVSEKILLPAETPMDLPVSAGFRNRDWGWVLPRRQGRGESTFSVWLSKSWATGRRFELARLVGDHLYSRDAEWLLPATGAKTARQKVQRAFAQQFLCPIEDLKAFLNTERPNSEQMEAAAREFEVSSLLIRNTLVNHGLIDRSMLMEF
jgi:hypothetical protein